MFYSSYSAAAIKSQNVTGVDSRSEFIKGPQRHGDNIKTPGNSKSSKKLSVTGGSMSFNRL